MKRIILFFSLATTILLTGCLEITDEITLKSNGSGVLTTTNDMSMLLSMMKSMGGAEEMKDQNATDTTINLYVLADSVSSLLPEEKELIKKGKLNMVINVADEKMLTKLEIPFSRTDEIEKIKSGAAKISTYFLGKSAGEGMPPGMDEKIPSSDMISGYYTTSYSSGVIETKLDKEKYAGLENDEMMKAVKEMTENGMTMSNTVIFNLPKPVKLTTGKKVTVSEDKKKVTIKTSSEDFFDDPTTLEYKIEY